MALTRVFTVEGSQVSNGSSDELTESDNDSWVIERVQVRDEDGNLGSVSDVTISVGGNSVTDQVLPLDTLAAEYDQLPPMNLNWPQNTQLKFAYTNESGGNVTLDFVVWVREAGSNETDMTPGEVISTEA